jgi:hypothetical protein
MQNIISQSLFSINQPIDLNIKHSLQHIFLKDGATDIFSRAKAHRNNSNTTASREEKVNTKGRRTAPVATRVVVVVQASDHLVADGNVCVVALEGSSVLAKQGSEVIAMGGAKVCAGAGSRVTAMPGSQVFARKGSTILIRSGAEIHRQYGATLETTQPVNVAA